MLPIASLLIVLTFSVLVTRVASVSLMLTGLSRESARFQARSALTGVGFTTTEAESVVGHPVRRRIVMILMLLGNIGLITVVSTLLLSFLGAGQSEGRWLGFGFLLVGIVLLLAVTISPWVDRQLSRVIERALRRFSDLEARDYASLLHLSDDYDVAEVMITDDDWMADKTLAQMRLRSEGILVLGIQRQDGRYVGAPRGSTRVEIGDTLIVYGRSNGVAELDCRCEIGGDELHEEALTKHREEGDDSRLESAEED